MNKILILLFSFIVFSVFAQDSYTISIVSINEYHSEIILPNKKLDFLGEDMKPYKAIAMGWGNKKLYKDADFFDRSRTEQAKLLASAFLIPSMGVTHTRGLYHEGPELKRYHVDHLDIKLDESQYDRLVEVVSEWFAKDHSGLAILDLKGVYGRDSRFFQSSDLKNYYAGFTCNSWVAHILETAELRSFWGPYPLLSSSLFKKIQDQD